MEPIPAPPSGKKCVLIVTNDSEVFLSNKLEEAGNLFGGRLTEVKNFYERINSEFGEKGTGELTVSFAVISTLFGFVPSNYMISRYSYVMNCKEQYIAAQERKDYAGIMGYISNAYDLVLVCVPKEMFRILAEKGALIKGKTVAVTAKEFEPMCKENGWIYLERKGARLGKENSEKVRELIAGLV